jgi:hypothetical protein
MLLPSALPTFATALAPRILSSLSQILKPAEKKAKFQYGGMNVGRPVTPPRKQKKKGSEAK